MAFQRDGDMFELADDVVQNAVIKVIGVGGGGGNAVQAMIDNNIEGVEFICANTDAQALNNCGAGTIIQLGNGLTKGLGAGANPEVGRLAAQEDRDRIAEAIKGSDMLFITAGMGGGTGTGAAPIVAEVAKELDILTVAVVTKPFPFEGKKRMNYADQGLKMLSENVDSLIVVPNEKLLPTLGKNVSLKNAFFEVNKILLGAVQGISELITNPGLINVDFADVSTVMSEMGMAMMGTGTARGENRAIEAAEKALRSPLLEDVDLHGARGLLVNVTCSEDLGLDEFSAIGELVNQYAADDATVVIGTAIDSSLSDELRVVVVATGIGVAKMKSPIEAVRTESVEPRPKKVVDNTQAVSAVGAPDYSQYDRPAAARYAGNVSGNAQRAEQPVADDMAYLDIPAFLRRQAD